MIVLPLLPVCEIISKPEEVNLCSMIGQTLASLHADLLDVHNQRLAQMDVYGVDFVSIFLLHLH